MNESRPESSQQSGESNGAVTQGRPEELLAEALRAKAGQTGRNASVVTDESQTDRLTPPSDADQSESVESDIQRISLGWVMVLAALLGLAAGALVGLLTVA